MLAQVATDAAPWVGYGVAGILAWFLWYKTAISDPRDRNEHRLQLSEIVTTHNATVQSLKDEYLRVIKEVRDECREERAQFLVELASERAIRGELEEKRQLSEQQRHADHMAMTQAINRLSEMVAQKLDWKQTGPAKGT